MIKKLRTTVTVAQAVLLLDTVKKEFERNGEDEAAYAATQSLYGVFESANKANLSATGVLVSGELDEEQITRLIADSGKAETKTETLAFDMDSMDKEDVLEKISEFLNAHEVK